MSKTVWVDPKELVGLIGFAAIAGLNHATARSLRYRGQLPSPVVVVGGTIPLWTKTQAEEYREGRSQ